MLCCSDVQVFLEPSPGSLGPVEGVLPRSSSLNRLDLSILSRKASTAVEEINGRSRSLNDDQHLSQGFLVHRCYRVPQIDLGMILRLSPFFYVREADVF